MSYDDISSGDRDADVSGACRFHCPPAGSSTSTPIIAAVSFGLLTAGEVFLIIGGFGWWVMPVALFVAMFCVMFVGISWEMGRDIMRINHEAMTRPARKRPEPPEPPITVVKMLCEDCPHENFFGPGPQILGRPPARPTTTRTPPDVDD
jgi:hypothetical protein